MLPVTIALCLALLFAKVPLLVQLYVRLKTLLFFICDKWEKNILPHLCIQNETRNSKIPPKPDPPPPTGVFNLRTNLQPEPGGPNECQLAIAPGEGVTTDQDVRLTQ